MNDHTILVVDAGQETEEKIVSTLETEGYLVFTASGRDVNSGLAEKISPELIYLQPTSNSVEGFAICKIIHNTEKFRNVPIILLASLKGPLDTRYTTFYGIVDYIRIPVNAEELVGKTGNILGISSSDVQGPETDIWPVEEAGAPSEELSDIEDKYAVDSEINEMSDIGQFTEEDIGDVEEENVIEKAKPEIREVYAPDTETDNVSDKVSGFGDVEEENVIEKAKPEIREVYAPDAETDNVSDKVSDPGEPDPDYTKGEERDKLRTAFSLSGHRRRPKKSGLLLPFIVAAVLAAIVLSGFLFYQLYLSPEEVKAPVAVQAPKVVQPQETAVLPSPEQQKQEQPMAGESPVKSIEASKEAPALKPEEAPVARPVVKPAAKPFAKPVYSVQLGAFKDEGNADALARTFKGKGYEAFTYTETKDKGIHRVLIGKFADRKEALKLANQIHTKEKVNTTVFSEALK